MNDLRHDPAVDPVAERTAFLRQWQQVPDGVASWGRTVMHSGGATWTNVDPPAPEAPDLRTVGEKVAELGEAVAALQDDSGHTAHKLRELTARVTEHEDGIRYLENTLTAFGAQVVEIAENLTQSTEQMTQLLQVVYHLTARVAHVERLLHKALNPGEQEATE